MRFDEDFLFRDDYAYPAAPALNGWTAFGAEADNHLVGFQMGCNGDYRMGCQGRWALRCSGNVGLYGNHAEVRHSITGTGNARDVVTGAPLTTFETDEDNVAVIGELRAGVSYQYSCNWRFYSGWRALGVTGVALATEQVPNMFTPWVSTNGSLFLHGLQTGVECTY